MSDVDAIALEATYQIENAFAVKRGKGGYVQRRAAVQVIVANAIRALSPPEPTEGLLERIADAIDEARYKHPEHPRERMVPFSDAYPGDREYARRLARAAIRAMPLQDHGWRDIDTAPKDGTMIILWVEAIDKEDSCHPTENAMAWRTIGFNNLEHDGDDIWKFSGWCWQHDHFVEGDGTPTKWMPMPPPAAPAMVAEDGISEVKS